MTTKLFTVAGTSKLNGETKVRFANDLTRVNTLHKNGHTNIVLIELSCAMTKTQALRECYHRSEFGSPEQQEAIENWVVRNGDSRVFVAENSECALAINNLAEAEPSS